MTDRVSLVVAMSENRVIGRDGALPWHLPDDLRRFRQLTTGHPILMGRRTHVSIGRALPERRNLVLSRDPAFAAQGVEVFATLDAALDAVAEAAEVFVIGGAAVFAEAFPLAARLHLTLVHAQIEGDVFFPPFEETEWILSRDEHHAADASHRYAFSFRTYERRLNAATASAAR